VKRDERSALLDFAASDSAEDGNVFVIGVVDAVAVDEIEPPHDADAVGNALHRAGQFFVAGCDDKRVMERFVERGDLPALAQTPLQGHVPHWLELVEHVQDDVR
jgi:hypothetical protein